MGGLWQPDGLEKGRSGAHIWDMARVLIPVVEVTAPDGTKSLWAAFAVSHREALAAVKEMIPADHTAELSLRRLPRSQKVEGLHPGEVCRLDP
jgi:hypothetical protein